MKALDTNVLVRFLTGDDPAQSGKVISLFRSAQASGERFHVCSLVLLELAWVLESLYKYRREEILSAFENMLALPVLSMESPEIIEAFLAAAAGSKADLSDLLIGVSSKARECEITLTFDKKAAKETALFQSLN
jgi:predicted nucleic-acid-binding protein